MTNVSAEKKFKIGLVSCLIGILNLSYIGLLIFNPFAGTSLFGNFDPFGQVLGLFFVPFLFLVIPAIGNGIGLLVGVVGLFEPSQRKSVAAIGMILNAIVPIAMIMMFLKEFYFSGQPQ